MGIAFCTRCGEPRLGSSRSCRKCGLVYETAGHFSDVAPGPPSSRGPTELRIKRKDLLLLLLVGAGLAACLTMVAAYSVVPPSVRLVLGVMIVFVLPGFAAVCAVLPPWQLTLGEHLVASLGISLALATSTAVFLGATPIGLSRESFSLALGSCTWALSLVAVWRWRSARDERRDGQSPSAGIGS